MDKSMFKDISGINKFFLYFPNVQWHYFREIIEFKYYRVYDYENWCDKIYIDLRIGDSSKKDMIQLKLKEVSEDGQFNLCRWISGLEIVNLKDTGMELGYEILDFEDSHLHFYCSDIEIEVISVDGLIID